jgi:transcription factor TGA
MFFILAKQSPTSLDINPSAYRAQHQRLSIEKGHPSNLVSIPSGNIENWEESAMADASPRTDISTDVDTDDKNQRVMFLLLPLSICFFPPFTYDKF